MKKKLLYELTQCFPLCLTFQNHSAGIGEVIEWQEFAPVAFLIIKELRPARILEVGDELTCSYLSMCSAVALSKLETRCLCLTRRPFDIGQVPDPTSGLLSLHDRCYSHFSQVEHDVPPAWDPGYRSQALDLLHFNLPLSRQQMETLSSTWLPDLNPTGVTLVSGVGQFKESPLQEGLNRTFSLFHTRVLQLKNWLAVCSRNPVGIVKDLIQQTAEDQLTIDQLLALNSERQRVAEELTGLRTERQVMLDELSAARSEEEHIANLRKQLQTAEESEIDAQIRFGQAQLRIHQAKALSQELERELKEFRQDQEFKRNITEVVSRTPEAGLSAAWTLLSRIQQRFTSTCEMPSLPGRALWDSCGELVLQSVLRGQEHLVFPQHPSPLLSVITILRHKAHLSVLAFCALLLEPYDDYELIVVDNGSTDETADLLSHIANATIISNGENLGFGAACQQAASRANSSYLCFLNNDALIEPGSLRATVSLLQSQNNIGAVGGKILLADGKLQEAGCIVWRDGRTHQYGSGDNPSLPEYCVARPVDYCSAALLVTPRSLFEEIGGFDTVYGLGYYEDVDYCMKVWSADKEVWYEPNAVVHHYGSASSETLSKAWEMTAANHSKFTARWREVLKLHHEERPENIPNARRAARARTRF